MTRKWSLPLFACAASVAVGVVAPARAANPGAAAPAAGDEPVSARPTIRAHQYTLEECLALADRNFPNLWAARARLASTHAQLEEARWTPWFQWNASSQFGVMPPLSGTVVFPQSTLSSRNITAPRRPAAVLPVRHQRRRAHLHVRQDRARRSTRPRRTCACPSGTWRRSRQTDAHGRAPAYYGLQLARDAKYVANDALSGSTGASRASRRRSRRATRASNDADRLRLETYKQELIAQSLQAPKGEAYALAALRFMTGVETGFDMVDEPLKRPDRPLVGDRAVPGGGAHPPARREHGARGHRRPQGDGRVQPRPACSRTSGSAWAPTSSRTPSAVPAGQRVGERQLRTTSTTTSPSGLRWSLDLLPQVGAHAAGRVAARGDARARAPRSRQRRARGREGLRRRGRGQGPRGGLGQGRAPGQAVDLHGAGPHRSRHLGRDDAHLAAAGLRQRARAHLTALMDSTSR